MNVAEMTHDLTEEARQLGSYLDTLRLRLGAWEMRSGAWFQRVVETFLEHHEQRRAPIVMTADAATRTARGNSFIRRAQVLVALSSAGSGAAWTGATVAAANANGLAGILTLPLAGIVGAGEVLFRATVQLQLIRDLCELHGHPLGISHRDELIRLYALAMGMIRRRDNADLGRGEVAKLAQVDGEELGKAVGTRIVGETALRTIVPFVGIAAAAAGSAMMTAKLGRFMRAYLIYRGELIEFLDEIRRRSPACVAPLMHGLWSVFTARGPLDRPSSAVLGEILRDAEEEVRSDMLAGFVPGNSDWMYQLDRSADEKTRDLALRALTIAAAVDAIVEPDEVAILTRAAQVMHRSFDTADAVKLAAQIGAPH